MTRITRELSEFQYVARFTGVHWFNFSNLFSWITTKDVAMGFPKAEEFGYKNEAEAFLQQYGHGIGLGQWERPIISRRFSLEHPQEIKENMVFAVETWCKAEDNSGAARIEEVVCVTKDGCELLTTYPADHLISCGTPGSEIYV